MLGFKKVLKFICTLILILVLIVFFFKVIKPAYLDYKQNAKNALLYKSEQRAKSKNNIQKSTSSSDKSKDSESSKEHSSEEEIKGKEFDPIVFDDRILLYIGEMNSDSIKQLANTLIEDIDSKTYAKIDVHFENIKLSSSDISYSDKENYRLVLNEFKNSISSKDTYLVEANYNKTKTVVNKIIITKK